MFKEIQHGKENHPLGRVLTGLISCLVTGSSGCLFSSDIPKPPILQKEAILVFYR